MQRSFDRGPGAFCARRAGIIVDALPFSGPSALGRSLEEQMRRTGIFVALAACVGLLVVSAASIDVRAGDDHERGKREVALRDDCDPRDTGWGATGGCSLRDGDVTVAEFNSTACPRSRRR